MAGHSDVLNVLIFAFLVTYASGASDDDLKDKYRMSCQDETFSFFDGCNPNFGCKCPPKEPFEGCGTTKLYCGNNEKDVKLAYNETLRVCCTKPKAIAKYVIKCEEEKFEYYNGCHMIVGCKCSPKVSQDGCITTKMYCPEMGMSQGYNEALKVCCNA